MQHNLDNPEGNTPFNKFPLEGIKPQSSELATTHRNQTSKHARSPMTAGTSNQNDQQKTTAGKSASDCVMLGAHGLWSALNKASTIQGAAP